MTLLPRRSQPTLLTPLVHMRVLHAAPCLVAVVTLLCATAAAAQTPYYPPAGDAWERRAPAALGMDADRVQQAVRIAVDSESSSPVDLLENHRRSFGREPHGEAIGPFRDRGAATGLVVRNGYIIAEWGDPKRVDVTFSVTKSFVSTVVGLAHDHGLIRDVHEPVYSSMAPVLAASGTGDAGGSDVASEFELLPLFETEHSRRVTWDHLLRQTSDWQGTLWGKPDWADRPRGDHEEWRNRARHEPGAVYMYNDVRVNLLALAALNVWRQPLPQVLREHVMDPIGASQTWRWYGYDNSWIVLDGQLVQSVSGGAHWGGGMFISALDMARFGLLTLRRGRWADRQIISEEWIRSATTPGINTAYGYMNFFLNTGRRALAAAPEEAFYHLGAGNNVIYVDPVNDIVIVARWINNLRSLNAMIEQLLAGG
ncbi:serine hydrolase [soil metagenome]